jgi:hypothetical protein
MWLMVPKARIEVSRLERPFYYLAGPLQGGGDWRTRFVGEMARTLTRGTVAVPVRYLRPIPSVQTVSADSTDTFAHQLEWERYYLNIASRIGCIIFWLPRESPTDRRADGQPYARDTYGELGEWRGRLLYNFNLKVVIGAEEGFPGLDVIVRNYREALGEQFPIYRTMEETIRAAIARASGTR